ncbi:hypothetical protein BDN70DRAFT_879624 [Pholiota conissans]|uniref:Uncharacterized protein n=1 Tax=Pholiota conissans TaxID=109636 RepID=A0A9P5Z3D9_9AGAR|nr:hypothetical protein BDN70DRAFT_879624 [Pholiota conissans]
MSGVLNHASSSASPSTSLSSLWAYVRPALDHIVKSPSNEINGKAPAIDFGLYAGIHSACYNYFITQSENSVNLPVMDDPDQSSVSRTDIYMWLDKYFTEAAREISIGVPLDDISLVKYTVFSFNRFHAGAQSADRLLSYVNRHYVRRAVDEDRGWLRLADVLESNSAMMTITSIEESHAVFARKLRERRLEELKKWGYRRGDSEEKAILAESCAEAASSPERVVPVLSLAHRRFRIEFIEPLLAVPKTATKIKAKVKHKIPKPPPGLYPAKPKGRLARAVQSLLETDAIDNEEKYFLVSTLANALLLIGVPEDHSLRKKLHKHIEISALTFSFFQH